MSKYTTELRFIVEESAGLDQSAGQTSVNDTIDLALPKIFNFDFPIFDENYRKILEHKIVKHYYTREIGQESVGLWKLRLDTKLNEIMPYYNQLYKSELLTFNPLYNIDYNTTNNKTNNTTKNDNNNGSNHNVNNGTNHTATSSTLGNTNIDAISDTPQGALTNVENETYLSSAEKHTTSGTNNGTNDATTSNTADGTYSDTANSIIKSVDDYIDHVSGKNSGESYSELLKQFRETFLNVDMKVIDDLRDLFMLIW